MTILSNSDKLQYVSDSIATVPDFPKPGILFYDVQSILLNPTAFQYSLDILTERYKGKDIDAIAGFEARGFVFGAPLALALGVPFIMLRKPGKLPGETISADYITEYSTDSIHMKVEAVKSGDKVLLVDDLIATGGTLAAGVALIRKAGGEIVEAACVIELPELNGRSKIPDIAVYTLIEKEGA